VPVFSYTAIDPRARRVEGVVQAETPRQARMILLQRGIRTTALNPLAAAEKRSWKQGFTRLATRIAALRQRDRILDAFENLLTLLESHVPLEEAWDSLAQGGGGGGNALPVLHQLHDAIRLGRPMSSVMEEFPEHFDAVDVALLQAGEDSGELAEAIARFTTRRRMAGKLLSTFMGAMAYPIFLLVFGSAVVVFLTTKVIPNVNAMLLAAGGEVPLPTRILVTIGQLITLGIVPAILCVLALAIILNRRKSTFNLWLIRQTLKVPIIGKAWRHWQLAQFCLVLRTLLASGIHLPAALLLAGKTAGDGPVRRAAFALKEYLMEGHDLETSGDRGTQANDEGGGDGFPPWLWRALAVGQAAGDLVPVLERVGLRFEAAATKSAGRLAAILEPLMILIIGLLVGLVAYAALLPIIKLGGVW